MRNLPSLLHVVVRLCLEGYSDRTECLYDVRISDRRTTSTQTGAGQGSGEAEWTSSASQGLPGEGGGGGRFALQTPRTNAWRKMAGGS